MLEIRTLCDMGHLITCGVFLADFLEVAEMLCNVLTKVPSWGGDIPRTPYGGLATMAAGQGTSSG